MRELKKLNYEKIKQILDSRLGGCELPRLSQLPPPSAFCDMQKAAKTIAEYIKAHRKIAVVGDYDVDGVVASVILSGFFKAINYELLVRIPNRFNDGYGLNSSIVDELAAQNVQLIITVDNGISAHEAAERAKELGVLLIISDHHEPEQTLPNAFAIIDPKQEGCDFREQAGVDICGAQVAWYLCAAIKKELGANVELSRWLDVLCLAISADMMPMRGLNSSLMRAGLKALNTSQKPFVQALRAKFNKQVFDYESISFLISPLLNASGRMSDASDSFAFLSADDFGTACKMLEIICEHNNYRKQTETQIYELAKRQISADDKIALAYGLGWHRGVIGIVAGKLANHFARPAIVFGIEDGIASGSARSNANLDLLEMFEYAKDYVKGFGGHKNAAGISCEAKKLSDFKKAINEYAAKCELEICNTALLGELALGECSLELFELISSYEPFGTDNEKPEFFARARVQSAKMLKARHLKLQLISEDANSPLEAICFNYSGEEICPRDWVEITYQLGKNDFFAPAKLQLLLQNLRKIAP